jgi:hypothetical protein
MGENCATPNSRNIIPMVKFAYPAFSPRKKSNPSPRMDISRALWKSLFCRLDHNLDE